jgi:hypothetical protein
MFKRYAPEKEIPPLEEPRFTDPAVPSRACCCAARPVVRVIMPPTADRARPVDLWLCGHHYRASLQALLAAGATVEDLTMTADQGQAYYAGAAA